MKNSVREFVFKMRWVILTPLIVFLSACKKKEEVKEVVKEVIVYQEPSHKWKRVKNFTDHGVELIRNANRIRGGMVYFSGYNTDAVYDSVSNTLSFIWHYWTEYAVKPLITEKYNVRTEGGSILLFPHNNLPESASPLTYTELGLNISYFDPEFGGLRQGPWYSGLAIASPSLITFCYLGQSGHNHYLTFKLSFPYEPGWNDPDAFRIRRGDSLLLKDTLGFYANHLVGAAGPNLVFTMGNFKNYLVNDNLDTTVIAPNYTFNQIFEWQQEQYSFANIVAQGAKTSLIKTNDAGYTWQECAGDLDYNFQSLICQVVGTKLIGHNGGQLWEITISAGSVTAKELVTDGLQGVRIKSVVCSNARVFVCTETGVFERPYSEFIEYK